jgi:hypothetical protein
MSARRPERAAAAEAAGPGAGAEPVTRAQLRAAVAGALAHLTIDAAAAGEIDGVLERYERERVPDSGEWTAAANPAECEEAGLLALPPPDSSLVKIPPSVRMTLGVSMFGAVDSLMRDLRGRDEGLPSAEQLWYHGFSCQDLYNSGLDKRDIALTKDMVLGTQQRPHYMLGELAVYFGFSRAEVCAALSVPDTRKLTSDGRKKILALYLTRQSAESYAAIGMNADFWCEMGVSLQMMTSMPFGVREICSELGLTYAQARRMGLGPDLCAHPGWSYGDLRSALGMDAAQLQAAGLILGNILVVPAR